MHGSHQRRPTVATLCLQPSIHDPKILHKFCHSDHAVPHGDPYILGHLLTCAGTCAETYAGTYAGTYAETCTETCAETCAETYAGTYAGTYAETCAETNAGTYAETYTETCVETYAETYAETRTDTHPDAEICTHALFVSTCFVLYLKRLVHAHMRACVHTPQVLALQPFAIIMSQQKPELIQNLNP